MQLKDSDTLYALAASATSVNCTVWGDDVASGSDNFKVLYHAQLPNTATALAGGTTGHQVLVDSIILRNKTGSPIVVTFLANGTAAADEILAVTLLANGHATIDNRNVVRVYDSTMTLVTTSSFVFTGDVTGSGTNAIALTIANSAVTNAKMANMAANSIKINNTGSPAAPIDGTAAQTKTLLAIAAGDVSGLAASATTDATNATNISSGTLPAGRLPALTGDVTTTIGTVATTIASHTVSNAKFRQGTGLSIVGVTGSVTADVADIVGTANQTLVVNAGGTALAFGALNVNSATAITGQLASASFPTLTGDVTTTGGSLITAVANAAITNVKMANMSGLSAKVNPSSSAGVPQDVVGTATQVLRVNGAGTSIAFGAVDLTNASAVTGQLIAGSFPVLTGDITTGGGALATTLKNTGPGALGPLGSATVAPIVTIDAQGRVTAFTSATITPALGSITGFGTGVATALATNVGSAGAPVVLNGAGGTPSAITLTNGTGLPTTGLTGTLQVAQEPAHTGDATNTAGSLAMAVVKIQGQAVSSATPAVGQVLEYGQSSTWTPTTMFYNVISFGADPTGSADSTTAINAAITAASANGFTGATGGVIWFPAGRYKITSTIVITNNNITLMGVGGGASEDFGNYYTAMASHLVPSGAFKAIQVLPVQTNGLSGQANHGFKLKGLGIDNFANAGTMGLQLISSQNFDVDDFYAINSTSVGLDFNTLPGATFNGALAFPLSAATLTVNSTAGSGTGPAFPANTNTAGTIVAISGAGSTTPGQKILVTYTGGTGTTFTGCSSAGLGTGTFATLTSVVQILPGAQDCTRGRVGQINLRQLDSGGASGHGIQLNGDLGGLANTNLINFVGPIKIFHSNGNGINDVNSDTNYFGVGTIQRTGGTGAGAMIGAGSVNTFASRNNVFSHWSFGAGGLVARGTPTAAFPSGPTRVLSYQLANAEALPTVEAGALLDVYFNGCFKVGNLTQPTITTQVLTAATVNQITNTKFLVPPQGFQVGTHLMWQIPMIKTAVGTSWLYNLRYGTGAVSTGAILQTVTYTATAAIDGGILEIHSIITALGSGTSATNTGYAVLKHGLTITGLCTGVTTPAADVTSVTGHIYTRPTFAGFDSTLPNTGVPQFLSIEINPVTASTVQTVESGAQAFCLAQSIF